MNRGMILASALLLTAGGVLCGEGESGMTADLLDVSDVGLRKEGGR